MDKQTQTALAIIAGLFVAFVAGGVFFSFGSGMVAALGPMPHGAPYIDGERAYQVHGRMMGEYGGSAETRPWADGDFCSPGDRWGECNDDRSFDGRRGGRGRMGQGFGSQGCVPPTFQDGQTPPCGSGCPLELEVKPEV